MRNAEAFELKSVSHKMALPVTRFLGKRLMNEQTSPLPANKELVCSTASLLHQDRRSAAVVCESCKRRQRYRIQSSFLISATAALALQPPCAPGPGAWKRSVGSAHNPFKCFGDQQEPREQLQPGTTRVHVLFPCHSFRVWPPVPACSPPSLNAQGILPSSAPMGCYQPFQHQLAESQSVLAHCLPPSCHQLLGEGSIPAAVQKHRKSFL